MWGNRVFQGATESLPHSVLLRLVNGSEEDYTETRSASVFRFINMSKPIRKPTVVSFFTKELEEKDTHPRWRIKGSGVRGFPSDADKTKAVIKILKDVGVPIREYTMSSPCNPSSYHVEAFFEDGGLRSVTGNYWYSERGAWISGEKAFDFIVQKLGLRKSL